MADAILNTDGSRPSTRDEDVAAIRTWLSIPRDRLRRIEQQIQDYAATAQTTMRVLEEEMAMRRVSERLDAVERAEFERLTTWAASLSEDQLEAEIDVRRRANPEAWAAAEALSIEEIDAELERRRNGERHGKR